LKGSPHNKKFDIIKDSSFSNSNENIKATIAELKRIGLGDVEHYSSINEADRKKLYTSMFLSSNTPVGLQFDIRLYFCRRRMENIPNMTKSTFEIKTDAKSGLRYVTKAKDELTKNHRGTEKDKNCWHNARDSRLRMLSS